MKTNSHVDRLIADINSDMVAYTGVEQGPSPEDLDRIGTAATMTVMVQWIMDMYETGVSMDDAIEHCRGRLAEKERRIEAFLVRVGEAFREGHGVDEAIEIARRGGRRGAVQ